MVECIQETDGFIVGEKYKCLGISGKYVEVEDAMGIAQIMSDTYFKMVGRWEHMDFQQLKEEYKILINKYPNLTKDEFKWLKALSYLLI